MSLLAGRRALNAACRKPMRHKKRRCRDALARHFEGPRGSGARGQLQMGGNDRRLPLRYSPNLCQQMPRVSVISTDLFWAKRRVQNVAQPVRRLTWKR
jgi:hypothetical protein